ncbi:hypothetical protein MLD38_036466 [Melastoma candidum]|uniref:Uncharacterized protein n=1 Tax=Melastoma candidum TaxID=119954 RepID=A0ACB9LKC5_9MYRT|nr:hypothetical protein MLD38_036466 [Melastoma candidum]
MACSSSTFMKQFVVVLILSAFITANCLQPDSTWNGNQGRDSRSAGVHAGTNDDDGGVFAGPCKTKADCAKPCAALGYLTTAFRCVPYNGSLRCLCLTN